ncbi:MAG: folate-binding protein YgfZ [Nitrosomonas sp.]|nr:folate-binding protein YgfZ [Nitrosomonas sp.]
MQAHWHTFLHTQHAVIEDGRVIRFGESRPESEQIQTETVLVDLSHYGLLIFSGEDAQAFLQNQLSCDVTLVNAHQAQYGSYCTPKGRVLANFILWQRDDEWFMQLPVNLCSAIRKRLSMFILRSKVRINESSDQWIRIGVAGKAACEQVAGTVHISVNADSPLQVIRTAQADVLCHAADRIELIVTPEHASELWNILRRHAQPSSADRWDWLAIQAGIPVITLETQEEFIPQMINLDLIGGVSFKKGCYPGQEIVARTQYLGKLKRRMYLAHIATRDCVSAGDDLYDAHFEDQSCGMIVNAALSPAGGYDVLAVIQRSSAAAGKIYWKTPQGPVLNIGTLPYALD